MSRHKFTERWLADYLAKGPRPFPDILAAAKAQGHSLASLRRAKKDLGVISFKPRAWRRTEPWCWRLQEESLPAAARRDNPPRKPSLH